jgi:hypothetical protein
MVLHVCLRAVLGQLCWPHPVWQHEGLGGNTRALHHAAFHYQVLQHLSSQSILAATHPGCCAGNEHKVQQRGAVRPHQQ